MPHLNTEWGAELEANKGFLKSEAERLVGALMAKVAARKVAARAEANAAAREGRGEGGADSEDLGEERTRGTEANAAAERCAHENGEVSPRPESGIDCLICAMVARQRSPRVKSWKRAPRRGGVAVYSGRPLQSTHGTCKTDTARLWPWLFCQKSCGEDGKVLLHCQPKPFSRVNCP